MKASTLHSLITARTLHDEARRLIAAGDRHMSSAGLILLQDALEIVFLAMLVEKDVDEEKSLESMTFDQLIGEIKKVGIAIPKSGTLKALNKQRVITKHYGQLAEPLTVQTYAEASDAAIDAIVQSVLGRPYREIFLSELLAEGEARTYLSDAATSLERGHFLAALISVRKALFVEIEIEYCVHKWANADPTEHDWLLSFTAGGSKAAYFTKNRAWAEKNVSTPFDYIQIDAEALRMDAVEWGVNTSELHNLRRLTPEVFRKEREAPWQVRYALQFPPNEANAANARYCLDRAISVLLRKQQHTNASRWPRQDEAFDPPPIYVNAPVFSKARSDSEVVHRLNDHYEYRLTQRVSGFNPPEQYYFITGNLPKKSDEEFATGWFSGFLLAQDDVEQRDQIH